MRIKFRIIHIVFIAKSVRVCELQVLASRPELPLYFLGIS